MSEKIWRNRKYDIHRGSDEMKTDSTKGPDDKNEEKFGENSNTETMESELAPTYSSDLVTSEPIGIASGENSNTEAMECDSVTSEPIGIATRRKGRRKQKNFFSKLLSRIQEDLAIVINKKFSKLSNEIWRNRKYYDIHFDIHRGSDEMKTDSTKGPDDKKEKFGENSNTETMECYYSDSVTSEPIGISGLPSKDIADKSTASAHGAQCLNRSGTNSDHSNSDEHLGTTR